VIRERAATGMKKLKNILKETASEKPKETPKKMLWRKRNNKSYLPVVLKIF